MKKFFYILILLTFFFSAGSFKTYSQTGNNVLLEFCTGTWCGYCPCGEYVAEGILASYPNTMILAYHGPVGEGDPWANFNGNSIINLIGFSNYPTGVVGRKTGIINWSAWNNPVAIQSLTLNPGVSIVVTKSYNSTTRQLTLTANCTSLREIDTACNINFVITEDHLWATQSNYNYCAQVTCTYCEHNWVVRNMVNGASGEVLSTGTWAPNTVKTANWTTTLDNSWVEGNCNADVFVYMVNGSLSSGSFVQQTKVQSVTLPVGVKNDNKPVSENYVLEQNYPNPFNPTTNIHFSLPKDGYTSLKIYDMVGSVVQNCIDGFVKKGTYNIEVDGSNLASGVYFYILKTNDFMQTKKMMLIK